MQDRFIDRFNEMPIWQKTLVRLRLLEMSGQRTNISETMHRLYPGDYKIIEFFDKESNKFDYEVEFDDPKKEMLWKLKWS